jgi:hypothetical protein
MESKNTLRLIIVILSAILILSSIACHQQTLLPFYTFTSNDDKATWELDIDTFCNQFYFNADLVWGDFDLSGTFVHHNNNLILSPYPGKFFINTQSDTNSGYSLKVFKYSYTKDMKEKEAPGFQLRITKQNLDTLILDSTVELEGVGFGTKVIVESIGHRPYMFKLEKPGIYHVFLYENLFHYGKKYNRNLLSWKVRKGVIYSKKRGLKLKGASKDLSAPR